MIQNIPSVQDGCADPTEVSTGTLVSISFILLRASISLCAAWKWRAVKMVNDTHLFEKVWGMLSFEWLIVWQAIWRLWLPQERIKPQVHTDLSAYKCPPPYWIVNEPSPCSHTPTFLHFTRNLCFVYSLCQVIVLQYFLDPLDYGILGNRIQFCYTLLNTCVVPLFIFYHSTGIWKDVPNVFVGWTRFDMAKTSHVGVSRYSWMPRSLLSAVDNGRPLFTNT